MTIVNWILLIGGVVLIIAGFALNILAGSMGDSGSPAPLLYDIGYGLIGLGLFLLVGGVFVRP